MWSIHIVQISDRKGLGEFFIDQRLGQKIFSQLSDEEQQLIKLNVVGGFQTEQRKSNWDADTKGECVFCGQADTRQHRLLECPFLWNYVGIIKPHAKFYRVRGLSGFFYHYRDNMTIQDY